MSIRRARISVSTAVRIDDLADGKRPGDHVHAKIAPAEILLERDLGAAFDAKIAVADTDRALAARGSDVDRLAPDGQLQDGKTTRPPRRPGRSRQPFDELFSGLGRRRRSLSRVRRLGAGLDLRTNLVPDAAPDGVEAPRGERRSEASVECRFHGKLAGETTSPRTPYRSSILREAAVRMVVDLAPGQRARALVPALGGEQVL